MRRQFLLASVGAIAITGSAFAADLTPPPPPPPPVPIFSWTGLYVGGQIGYAWDHDSVSAFFPGPNFSSGFPAFGVVSFSDSPNGVIGGVHVGYNLQINQWVAGVEGTVDGTSVSRSGVFNPFGFATLDESSTVQGSIRVRAGIAFDRVLLYGTGGAAFAGIDNVYTTSLTSPPFFLTERVSRTRSGWTAGGGLEYAVTNNWSIRAEYRYSDFGHFIDYPFTVLLSPFGTLFVQHHLTQNQVQFGFSYKFDSMAAVPVVAKY
jgi:outer membrane immunogenic protein